MMIFQFRALSDEAEEFLFDFEVAHDMNMLAFSRFIDSQLGYDPSVITSFFASDAEWEKLQEFTSFDMGATPDDLQYSLCDECDAPIAMEKVALDEIVTNKFDRLLYVFDPIAERQLYVELLRTLKREDEVSYPRVVELTGVAPAQI